MKYKKRIKKILKEMNQKKHDRVMSLVTLFEAKAVGASTESTTMVYLDLDQLSLISMALLYYAEAIKEKNNELKV